MDKALRPFSFISKLKSKNRQSQLNQQDQKDSVDKSKTTKFMTLKRKKPLENSFIVKFISDHLTKSIRKTYLSKAINLEHEEENGASSQLIDELSKQSLPHLQPTVKVSHKGSILPTEYRDVRVNQVNIENQNPPGMLSWVQAIHRLP